MVCGAASTVPAQFERCVCMATAMQTQRSNCAGTVEAAPHTIQCLRDYAAINFDEFCRNEIMLQQVSTRFHTEALDVQRGTLEIRLQRADGMYATDEASHPFQRLAVVQLRRATAVFGEHGKTEAVECVQRMTVDFQCGHNGNFALDQCRDKGMLFQNGRIRPACGAC